MIWFYLFQLLGLAVVILGWHVYSKYFHPKEYQDTVYDVITDNIKKFVISLAVVFVVLSAVMFKPLYHTTQCSIKGVSMNANTKYSWVMGDCLMETKNGSWIPLKITRGVPDGADSNHDGYAD